MAVSKMTTFGGHRDLRSLGITDSPVTAMTVTRCDGRDITGVRYPPFWALIPCRGLAFGPCPNGAICVRYPVGSWPPAMRPNRNLVAPGEPVLALGQGLSGSWCAWRR